jgi:hypothetical protein
VSLHVRDNFAGDAAGAGSASSEAAGADATACVGVSSAGRARLCSINLEVVGSAGKAAGYSGDSSGSLLTGGAHSAGGSSASVLASRACAGSSSEGDSGFAGQAVSRTSTIAGAARGIARLNHPIR